jgi:hypothetical protein
MDGTIGCSSFHFAYLTMLQFLYVNFEFTCFAQNRLIAMDLLDAMTWHATDLCQ